jgi:SAM-dependent methyltransferase
MSQQVLHAHRDLWQRKPVLRAIYRDYYRRIVAAAKPGRSLEIGGGSGNLKEHSSDVVSTDLVPTPWLDAAADAQALPFKDGVFENIVAVDVVHHIERPQRFFREAERVLKQGGRLVLLEPGITPGSWVFYKLFHPEPVEMGADPFADGPADPGRKPFDSNQAIPTLLFVQWRKTFEQRFPQLRILRLDWISLLAYPLSGGFRPWSLLPAVAAPGLVRIEDKLSRFVGRYIAFRLFIVLEKQ